MPAMLLFWIVRELVTLLPVLLCSMKRLTTVVIRRQESNPQSLVMTPWIDMVPDKAMIGVEPLDFFLG